MDTAIILSGGIGSRVKNGGCPKQYILVCGKPVIWYTMRVVMREEALARWVIVAAHEWQGEILRLFLELKKELGREGLPVTFAPPGASRQGSIRNALREIDRLDSGLRRDGDYAAVIDAVRPKLPQGLLEGCIRRAHESDGAIPALPMKDTVYFSAGGRKLAGNIDRSAVIAGQSPEVFHFGKYFEANERLTDQELSRIQGSSQPAVMAGMEILLMDGDEENYKITTDRDLRRFRDECEWNQGQ